MVSSVQSSNTASQQLQQQVQDFKDGILNLSKTDIKNDIIKSVTEGSTPSSALMDIYESFNQIDDNGDGLSYEEFETYKNSRTGMLNSLGITSQMDLTTNKINTAILSAYKGESTQQDNLLSSYFSKNSISKVLKNYSSYNNYSANTSTYINTLMQNYLQSSNSGESNPLLNSNFFV
jgi:hypothetical protein